MCTILECLNECVQKCLPEVDNSKKKTFPGWNDEVKPFRENALFWHSIWLSCGKPLNNTVHNIMKKTRNVYHFQIRKCRKAADRLKRDRLLNACITGEGDIFHELKKIRMVNPTIPSSIDGVKNDIPGHFANAYQKLYNSTDDEKEMSKMYSSISNSIDHTSLDDVDLITTEKVKEATMNLKSNRNDPLFDFNSDCLKNAPEILIEHLAYTIKSSLIHAHITNCLLLATIIPLIKDKLGNLTSSSNYRSIALSSLVLKIFDWLIILLFGESLGLDDLQFSYQKNCSTTMCTWMVIEGISYFLRNGSDVFTCTMDMSKAFDMVRHSLLFEKLINLGVSCIFIRLLMKMYTQQYANVRWNGKVSHQFNIRNGVKQGAVLSAILYCVYVDGLFKKLREKRTGCWINGDFMGIIGYADDNILISPTLDGLQDMIDTCVEYASKHNLVFSTNDDPKKSKTKCMSFLQKKRPLKDMTLYGKKLPWVDYFRHLGNTIVNNIDGMSQDILEKRAQYIAKNNELVQEFSFAYPSTKCLINNIFNTHFTGSSIWNLFNSASQKLEKSWNVSVRTMLSLPRETHKYLIEPLSETKHIKISLMKRYLRFCNMLSESKKNALKNLYYDIKQDCRSTTGYNLRKIMLMNDEWNGDFAQIYYPLPDLESWRVPLIQELLDIKFGKANVSNFANDELDAISRFACCS